MSIQEISAKNTWLINIVVVYITMRSECQRKGDINQYAKPQSWKLYFTCEKTVL